MPLMAHVVLATIGSLGDLHPFIAIGRALLAQGHTVLLACPQDGVAKARAAGLEAAAIVPSYTTICERLDLTPAEVAARLMAEPNFVLDEILLPSLEPSVAALDRLVQDADVLAGSIFALAAEIVAEKRGLALASVVLQPMTLFSAWQPPATPGFGMMRHQPRTRLARGWNRAIYVLARAALRQRHGRTIDAVRAKHGLAPVRNAPILDHGAATAALVCCWSPVLGPLPPDAPEYATITGFPFFDSESGADEPVLGPELADFLSRHDRPLVFTLGSVAVASAGRFYEEAALASKAIGRPALLLTGEPGPPRRDGDCLFVAYAPHSAVFAHAAAVIHHGGAGTTGQALRAGVPQIVVPHFADQFDNAARLSAAGLARTIARKAFVAERAAQTLTQVLSSQDIKAAARGAAKAIAKEDGACEAARCIASLCA